MGLTYNRGIIAMKLGASRESSFNLFNCSNENEK